MTTPIDVIIPVFRGFEATRRCIESVLSSSVHAPHEIIIVDDASPDPQIADYVRDVAARNRATLIAQPATQGFSAAMNRAFALHRDRDKVVLHADAEVAGDWLDRLALHANASGVGVVGTFTNNAGAALYPAKRRDGALPEGCPNPEGPEGCANQLAHYVRGHLYPGEAPRECERESHSRIEMTTGNCARRRR